MTKWQAARRADPAERYYADMKRTKDFERRGPVVLLLLGMIGFWVWVATHVTIVVTP